MIWLWVEPATGAAEAMCYGMQAAFFSRSKPTIEQTGPKDRAVELQKFFVFCLWCTKCLYNCVMTYLAESDSTLVTWTTQSFCCKLQTVKTSRKQMETASNCIQNLRSVIYMIYNLWSTSYQVKTTHLHSIKAALNSIQYWTSISGYYELQNWCFV